MKDAWLKLLLVFGMTVSWHRPKVNEEATSVMGMSANLFSVVWVQL